MARLDLAPAVVGYLERHAVDVDLAFELGVRSGPDDSILYPYDAAARRALRPHAATSTSGITKQPKGEPLILWWPAGRPEPGAEVLLCRGRAGRAGGALGAERRSRSRSAAIPGTDDPGRAGDGRARRRRRASTSGAGRRRAPGARRPTAIARALQQFTDAARWCGSATARISRPGSIARTIARAGCAPQLEERAGGAEAEVEGRGRRLSPQGRRPHAGPARPRDRPERARARRAARRGSSATSSTYVVLAGDREGRGALRARGRQHAGAVDASHLDVLGLVGDAVFAGYERGAASRRRRCCMEVLASISPPRMARGEPEPGGALSQDRPPPADPVPGRARQLRRSTRSATRSRCSTPATSRESKVPRCNETRRARGVRVLLPEGLCRARRAADGPGAAQPLDHAQDGAEARRRAGRDPASRPTPGPGPRSSASAAGPGPSATSTS